MTSVVGLASGSRPGPGLPPGSESVPKALCANRQRIASLFPTAHRFALGKLEPTAHCFALCQA